MSRNWYDHSRYVFTNIWLTGTETIHFALAMAQTALMDKRWSSNSTEPHQKVRCVEKLVGLEYNHSSNSTSKQTADEYSSSSHCDEMGSDKVAACDINVAGKDDDDSVDLVSQQ